MTANQCESRILSILGEYLSGIMARSIMTLCVSRAGVQLDRLQNGGGEKLLQELRKGLELYVEDAAARHCCLERVANAIQGRHDSAPRSHELVNVAIHSETDIVKARGIGRSLCARLGFSTYAQLKMTTAISELARNIVQYAGKGEMLLSMSDRTKPRFVQVMATDRGPGIQNIDLVLAGQYQSRTGMGKGLTGTRELMDEFEVETGPDHGTTITARMYAA